jgi:hypothetical protein
MRRNPMRRNALATALAIVALAGAVGALAQALPEGMRARIAQLPAAQRDLLYAREATLRAMDDAGRRAFDARRAEWKALPDAERRERRERWQAWATLPATDRARMHTAAASFNALPVQAQLDLRARYAQLDEADRRGWLLGPALGADWPVLQPLLLQVPPVQRAPLLQALRAMTPQQRADLGVLAQRTPPQGRDQLRQQLLAQPAARRGAWLVAQLDR